MSRIYYTKPSITELEQRYASDAAAHGWGDRCYEYIDRFERHVRRAPRRARTRSRRRVAPARCSLGLAGLGIGAGDEVILGDINWIASVAPVVHAGATPVLVDVLPDTWCVDPSAVEAAITPRTKAIIAVHLYGNLCDMDRLLAIGERHGIAVIEDAAEAIGPIWRGRRAGSMGRFSTFSFHGTKTVTTGEGGLFASADAELYETCPDLVESRPRARRNAPVLAEHGGF
ncbi:MAG: DegT/DnrJ/EryC1/StrS family aminotransferase [Comamonadaceae bacterium]|nr:DegT/DnrJ/EryC1/StrS family aminotransferase [Comamonadaceae bacterium]